MKVIISLVFWVLCLVSFGFAQQDEPIVRKIYGSEDHDAFTSLVKFKGSYYCAFRSGEHHVYGEDGISRILVSDDAVNWREAATITLSGIDLRDPKLSITPDGRLMVLIGGSDYEQKELRGMLTRVSFSSDGVKFTPPEPVEIDTVVRSDFDWLWSVTWHANMAYGVMYQSKQKASYLVSSDDGITYTLITQLDLEGRPNEARIRFDDEDRMYILHRREEGGQTGFWGWADSPYLNWRWTEFPFRLGGPDFVLLENDQVLAASRIYNDEGNKTGLIFGQTEGSFADILLLPSGGDCSYPSILVEDDRLLISYYSSHEGNTDIYLAELKR